MTPTSIVLQHNRFVKWGSCDPSPPRSPAGDDGGPCASAEARDAKFHGVVHAVPNKGPMAGYSGYSKYSRLQEPSEVDH